MTKYISLLIFLASIFTNGYAQKIHFGIQGGAGIATITTDNEDFKDVENAYLGISKNYPVFSYGFNLYTGYSINENWGIAVEPGFIRKGFAKKVSDNDRILRKSSYLDYLHIPILAEFYLKDENITFSAGPELAFLLNANQKFNGANTDILNTYTDKKFDLGLQIGAYYTVKKHFDIGIKGGVSLLKIDDITLVNNANEVIGRYAQRNAYSHLFMRIKL